MWQPTIKTLSDAGCCKAVQSAVIFVFLYLSDATWIEPACPMLMHLRLSVALATINCYWPRFVCVCVFCTARWLCVVSKVQYTAENLASPEQWTYGYYEGYMGLGGGLCCGLSSLAAGLCIGVVGDAGVRGNAQRDILIALILMMIFAEALALYGFIVAIVLSASWRKSSPCDESNNFASSSERHKRTQSSSRFYNRVRRERDAPSQLHQRRVEKLMWARCTGIRGSTLIATENLGFKPLANW